MMRSRLAFLSVSLVLVFLFTGMIVASKEAKEELFQAFGNLAEVVHLVRTEYVDQLNPEALQTALDAGIMESVDRWSAVLGPDEVDPFRKLVQSAPPFGLVVSSRLGSAAVRHVIPGSPAAEAGLERWEVIEQVDGVYTRGRPLWQLQLELMKRQASSRPLTLTVLDQRVEDRREVVLGSVEWEPVPVTAEVRQEAIVIRIEILTKGAGDKVAALVDAERDVVLDLRNLLWGLEDEAIKVADLFVEEGVLGEWRGRRAGSRSFEAIAPVLTTRDPAVLVGPNTEGVGEILADALRRGGATLLGANTVGHAPHMRLVNDGDLALWIPVGWWLTANDEPINRQGVVPDVEVTPQEEQETVDPVLERALELFREPLEQAA